MCIRDSAGTAQSAPVFFVNPENGVSYPVVAQAPEHLVGSISDLQNLPISGAAGTAAQTLGGIATVKRSNTVPIISHFSIQPSIDIYASTHGRDLGAVAGDIQGAIDALASTCLLYTSRCV